MSRKRPAARSLKIGKSLVLNGTTQATVSFVILDRWSRVGKGELGDYSCDMHRAFTAFPQGRTGVTHSFASLICGLDNFHCDVLVQFLPAAPSEHKEKGTPKGDPTYSRLYTQLARDLANLGIGRDEIPEAAKSCGHTSTFEHLEQLMKKPVS